LSKRRGNRKTDYERESRKLFLTTVLTLALSFSFLASILYSRWDGIVAAILSSKIAIHLCHAAQTLISSLGNITKAAISLFILFLIPYGIVGFLKNFFSGVHSICKVEKETPVIVARGQEKRISGHSVILVPSNKVFAFSTGLIEGKIYVSEALASSLSEEELETVILHEAGHVKYRHPLKKLFLWSILRPLIFIPRRNELFERFRLMTELAADQYAVKMGADPLVLAESIVKTARLNSSGEAPQSAYFSSKEVSRRVRALLEEDRNPSSEKKAASFKGQILTLASSLALIGLLVLIPSVHLPHGCVKRSHANSGKAYAAKNVSICTEVNCKYCNKCWR